jgi:hypothetical protein
MQAFLPFLIVPFVIAALTFAGQWWSARSLPRAEPVSVPQMPQLPPNVRDLLQEIHAEAAPPLRLSALMPAEVIDRVLPPPPPPDKRTAAERYRLASVLLGEGGKPSAVIDGRVVAEGERFDAYRLLRVGVDHVVVVGPQGRERIDFSGAPPLLASAPARTAAPSAAAAPPALPPAPDTQTLERQFRRLLENLGH